MSANGASTPEQADPIEKKDGGLFEVGKTDAVEIENGTGQARFDEKQTARLLRKIDSKLIPFLAFLYLLSFLDRSNIGNARLAGMEADLGLHGLQYNVALSIFFPFYVAAEIPSNIMMKKTRPSIWIPSIMVAWGIICTLMGLVKSYPGLLAARAALGLAEGGLFPGITFYITMWYKRHECGLRMAIFFSAATAAGAFGGLLARAIVEMDGVGGLDGWAWIFIIEGLLTLITACVAFLYMHDYPDTAKFLTAVEKEEVLTRLKDDRSALADRFDRKFFWAALKDWKIWVHALITIGIYIPLYAYSLFLPSIVRGLGYSDSRAQLMSVPPYVVACLFCVMGGYFADRYGQRGVFMIGFCAIGIIGLVMLLSSHNNSVKYAGTFFLACGIYPNVPQGVAWNGNNIGGSLKRGVGIAIHVGIGNLGGVASGFLYLSHQGPQYYQGHGTLLATMTMSMCLCAFMTIYLRRENARRDATYKPPEEYSLEEKMAEQDMGDNASFFRYTV